MNVCQYEMAIEPDVITPREIEMEVLVMCDYQYEMMSHGLFEVQQIQYIKVSHVLYFV